MQEVGRLTEYICFLLFLCVGIDHQNVNSPPSQWEACDTTIGTGSVKCPVSPVLYLSRSCSSPADLTRVYRSSNIHDFLLSNYLDRSLDLVIVNTMCATKIL